MILSSKLNNRLISPDLIKAISILGVLFLHSPEILTSSNPIKFHLQEVLRFCVPCFIILWAYFFEKSYSKALNFQERFLYSKKRFISMFKIYFIYSTLYFLILVNWDTITLQKVITSHYLGHGFTGQYFFIIVFQLILLFPVFRYIYFKRNLMTFLIIIISCLYIYYTFYFNSLPVIFSKIGDSLFIFWVPYVLIGIGLARNEIIKIPLIFILTIFFVPLEWYLLRNFNLFHSGYITPMVLISSVLFCISLMQSKLNITNKLILKIIDFFGQNSLVFFVINPLVIVLVNTYLKPTNFLEINKIVLNLLDPFLSFLLVLLLCSFVTFLIKKTKSNGFLY